MAEDIQPKGSQEDTTLEGVQISDTDLEQTDKLTKQEKKEAKKRAKKLRTPEEKKKLKRRKILFGSISLLILVVVIFAVPMTRWPMLNALGFRGNIAVLVQDEDSNVTISDVNVLVDDSFVGTTDGSGQLRVSNIRLGDHNIKLQKAGYSRVDEEQTISFGTRKYNTSLKAIGIKIDIGVKDWLNNTSVVGAKISGGGSTATTDNKGRAALVIKPTDEDTAVSIKAKGYLDKKIQVAPKVASLDVSLVSSSKNYFISKRDGKYDIFKSNIDGSSQRKIIEATGKENQGLLQFSIHRNNRYALLVAIRDGTRLGDRLVAGIYKVDLEQASLKKIDEGSDVQLLGWAGDSAVYTKTSPETNYDDKNFTKLMSVNILSDTLAQQASSNYFQLATIVGEKVLYVAGDAYREIKNPKLVGVDPNSGARQTYQSGKSIRYGNQTTYGVLEFETDASEFYSLNVITGALQATDRQPSDINRYSLNQSANKVAYTDRRDGKGVLLVRNLKDGKEEPIVAISGLTTPVRWVSSRLVVARISTNQETADYVIDTNSGKYAKIVDVSDIGSQF